MSCRGRTGPLIWRLGLKENVIADDGECEGRVQEQVREGQREGCVSDEGSLVGSSFVSTTWMEWNGEFELIDGLFSCYGE